MIRIRSAVAQDLGSIAALIPDEDELFLVYPNGHFPFDLEQITALFNERFEFTAVCDGEQIIGFANLYQHEPGKYAFIGNVYIGQQYRGQGLGKLVLQYMIQAAFEKYRLPEVRLSVFADNHPAISLYHSFGFEQYAEEQRIDPHNNSKTLLHMALVNPDLEQAQS